MEAGWAFDAADGGGGCLGGREEERAGRVRLGHLVALSITVDQKTRNVPGIYVGRVLKPRGRNRYVCLLSSRGPVLSLPLSRSLYSQIILTHGRIAGPPYLPTCMRRSTTRA